MRTSSLNHNSECVIEAKPDEQKEIKKLCAAAEFRSEFSVGLSLQMTDLHYRWSFHSPIIQTDY